MHLLFNVENGLNFETTGSSGYMSEWFYVCCNTTARTRALLFLIDLGMKWLYFVRNSNTQWYAWLMTRKRVFIYETYCSLLYSAVCVGCALNVREFVCASVFGYRLVALSPLDTYNLPVLHKDKAPKIRYPSFHSSTWEDWRRKLHSEKIPKALLFSSLHLP